MQYEGLVFRSSNGKASDQQSGSRRFQPKPEVVNTKVVYLNELLKEVSQ